MKIYVFNPEHDMALATDVDNFTSPHAGREMRRDLGFLPSLWAREGEYVLVDDVEWAREAVRHLSLRTNGIFISAADLSHLLAQVTDDVDVEPWGWDRSLCYALRRMGVKASVLPSAEQLEAIRRVSHRGWAGEHLLRALRTIDGTAGESQQLTTVEAVHSYVAERCRVVLKAPWSSSGRGIRYVDDGMAADATPGTTSDAAQRFPAELEGWLRHVIQRQGCVMGEPFYDKVMDLGVELWSDGRGTVGYRGLSLFHTSAGAYTGNIIDTEKAKQERLGRLLDMAVFRNVTARLQELLGKGLNGIYRGKLGVDMMVVKQAGRLLLHPCVELNLRCTMGHVALAIPHEEGARSGVMRIGYTDKYRIGIGYSLE